jgi:hypothetical protein
MRGGGAKERIGRQEARSRVVKDGDSADNWLR